MSIFNDETNELLDEIYSRDDKEKFVELISDYEPEDVYTQLFCRCTNVPSKKCLLAMILGEGCPPAHEIFAQIACDLPEHYTPLAYVAYKMHTETDIIDLLLKQGPGVEHVNHKCSISFSNHLKVPLDHLFHAMSKAPELHSWANGDSLYKLVILLCQWKLKPSLDSARLLAQYTNSINDLAWQYVSTGSLVSLACLLLVAKEKVFLPFDSGLTIQQRISNVIDAMSSERNLGDEGTKYQSMLVEATKLIEIYERTGDALSLYSSSMHEYVPPDKALIDVANILKKAGYKLEPIDIDLRDSFRGWKCPELCNASLLKLVDPPTSPNISPSSFFQPHGLGATRRRYPYVGDCPLIHRVIRSGPMLDLMPSGSTPRLLSTMARLATAGQVDKGGSSIPRKHLANIAFKLKRGIRF